MSVLTVDFGGATITQIGYSLYDDSGTIIGARITSGIDTILAGQIFSTSVELTAAAKTVVWDTGGGSPVYATEDLTDYVNEIGLWNKEITDSSTGVVTRYQDDDSTAYKSADIYENADTATPYAGSAINRRERYT